jgi:hypothetical protein
MNHYLNTDADKKYEDHLLNAKDLYRHKEDIIYMAYWMCIIDCRITISEFKEKEDQNQVIYFINLKFVFIQRLLKWCKTTNYLNL